MFMHVQVHMYVYAHMCRGQKSALVSSHLLSIFEIGYLTALVILARLASEPFELPRPLWQTGATTPRFLSLDGGLTM